MDLHAFDMKINTRRGPEGRDSEQWLLENEKLEVNSHVESLHNRRQIVRLWTAQILLFLLSLFLFAHGLLPKNEVCQPQMGAISWYDRHVSNEHIYHRFEEENSAIYRHPGPAADVAWDRLFAYPPFRINATQFSEINGVTNAATFPPSQGGGYRASLGVFHHMHCVKILWQYTHRDYYQEREPWFFEDSDELLHTHLDHCADVVRQALMCNPDLSFELFRDDPEGDQAAPERIHDRPRACRDYGKVLEWVREQPRPE